MQVVLILPDKYVDDLIIRYPKLKSISKKTIMRKLVIDYLDCRVFESECYCDRDIKEMFGEKYL